MDCKIMLIPQNATRTVHSFPEVPNEREMWRCIKMLQQGSTAVPWDKKKETWEINIDNTNATYVTTDAQRKKNC